MRLTGARPPVDTGHEWQASCLESLAWLGCDAWRNPHRPPWASQPSHLVAAGREQTAALGG